MASVGRAKGIWHWKETKHFSSALTAQANEMVITTICVQIDNCFCNT